jgi:hypothetical protein
MKHPEAGKYDRCDERNRRSIRSLEDRRRLYEEYHGDTLKLVYLEVTFDGDVVYIHPFLATTNVRSRLVLFLMAPLVPVS